MQYQFLSDNVVTPFGILFIAAAILMWWWARRNAAAAGTDTSHVDLLVPLALFAGFAGGALLTLLSPDDKSIAGDALQTSLRIRLFAMVISGTIAVFIYSRLTKQSFRGLLEILALPTLAGLLVHRFGCFIAGCCFGDISVHTDELALIAGTDIGNQVQTLPWLAGEWVRTGIEYSPGTLPYQQQLALGLIDPAATSSLPVHPVQLYEITVLAVILLVARRIRFEHYPEGTLALYAIGSYAFVRFFLGYLRAADNMAIANLTTIQIQCVALLAFAGVAFTLQSKSRNRTS